jgi:eukaryotic-like serine/threonine-protein kinase
MAPEMALGEEVDGRTDIYAVGCVAYFTLTGHPVFEAETPMQMVARHLHTKPLPPSQRAGLPLPETLEQLVLACLAKEPKDRPQSAAALAQSLEAIPIEQWTEQRAAEWWRVNRPA